MIEAGTETTSAAINSCVLYLAANPDIQSLAHRKIVEVVGHKRMPSFDDEEQLPIVRCLTKEILRLRPAVVFGPLHKSTADIVYKDYFIPKGSAVGVATSAVHYDPELFHDPTAFRPQRYETDTLKAGASAAHSDPKKRDHYSFGTGRRICPGLHLSENSMFIVLASMLWAFEIRPAIAPDGKEMVLDTSDDAFQEGGLTTAKPFKARFIPRSEDTAKVILENWENAKNAGFWLGDVKVDVNGVVIDTPQ